MDRRTFLIRSAKLATGGLALSLLPGLAQAVEMADKAVQTASNGTLRFDHELYHRFANPDSIYHPFVRWWWNGDMVEIEELRRELRVMSCICSKRLALQESRSTQSVLPKRITIWANVHCAG